MAIALRLAEEGADIAINYQNTREHAQNVSRLVNQIGTVEELEKLCTVIERMDTREQAVAYLASEDGDYITGQVIDLNGGLYI